MKLKISLFSRTIIFSDFKRFWWVSALYGIILFFVLPMQHMLINFTPNDEAQRSFLLDTLHLNSGNVRQGPFSMNMQTLLLCTVPVILAVMLFSYLHSSRASTALHSLPVSRRTHLTSHTAAGLTLLVLPIVVNGIILAALSAFTDLGVYYSIFNVLEWMGLTLVFNFLLFSVTVFIGMFTGNPIAHIIFTYILNVLPYGLWMLVTSNLEILLYGFGNDRFNSGWAQPLPLMKLIGFSFHDFSVLTGFIYIITGIIFIVLSVIAYDFRNLEAAGSIVSFKKVKPVFKYGVTACLMLTGGFFTSYFSHADKPGVIAAYFIFAFIGYWLSEMLLEKTVRVWHAYKGFLAYAAIVILMLTGIFTDITGYVNRIPDQEDIVLAYYGDTYSAWSRELNNTNNALKYKTKGVFREKANISAVTRLQEELLKNRQNAYSNGRYIAYLLKDGSIILRMYKFDEYGLRKFVSPLYESLEYKERKFPVLKQQAEDIKYIEVGDRRTNKKPLILSDGLTVKSFIDTLKRQLAGAKYNEIISSSFPYTYIEVQGQDGRRDQYCLAKSFKEVYSWLDRAGYSRSALLQPEEIDHVTVQSVKFTRYETGYGFSSVGSEIELNDRTLIKNLFENFDYDSSSFTSGSRIRVRFFLGKGVGGPDFDGFLNVDSPVSKEMQERLKSGQ